MKEKLAELLSSAESARLSIEYTNAAGELVELTVDEARELLRRATGRPKQAKSIPVGASDDEESRTTAFGLLRYAEEYRQGAVLIHSNKVEGQHSTVASMLIGHSIELALKAFIRSRGASLRDLHDLHHNLKRSLDRATELRFDRLVKLSENAKHDICEFGEYHAAGSFRYIRTGALTLPSWASMATSASLLTHGLHAHCLRKTFGRKVALEILDNRGSDF